MADQAGDGGTAQAMGAHDMGLSIGRQDRERSGMQQGNLQGDDWK
jgi:hypothetical protein